MVSLNYLRMPLHGSGLMDDRMVCSILVSAPGPLGFQLIWGLGTKGLGPGLDNKGTPIDRDNLVRYSCNWSILVSAPGPLGFELIGGLGTKGLGPGLDNKGTPIDKDNLVRYFCNWELRVWGQGLTTRVPH